MKQSLMLNVEQLLLIEPERNLV